MSLSDADVEFLDSYAHEEGYESRSAVVRQALTLLRAEPLGEAYEDAWLGWEDTEEAALWEAVSADGLEEPRAPR